MATLRNRVTRFLRIVVRDLSHLTAQQHRHGAKKMIRILLLDDTLDLDFRRVVGIGVLETETDAAHAFFQQAFESLHDFGLRRMRWETNNVALGNQLA